MYPKQINLDWWNDLSDAWQNALIDFYKNHHDMTFTPENFDWQSLQEITVLSLSNLDSPDPLNDFTHLRALSLYSCHLRDLHAISNLEQLEFLNISCAPISDLEPLRLLPNLKVLSLNDHLIKDFSILGELTQVKGFDLESKFNGVRSLKMLEGKMNVTNLSVFGSKKIKNLPNLKSVTIAGKKRATIENCPNIETLDIAPSYDLREGFDCSNLGEIPNLKKLNIWRFNTSIEEWFASNTFEELEVLTISSSVNKILTLEWLTPQKFPKLTTLFIGVSAHIKTIPYPLPSINRFGYRFIEYSTSYEENIQESECRTYFPNASFIKDDISGERIKLISAWNFYRFTKGTFDEEIPEVLF
ncbi:leucine-rich repeat domain-containing protein [Flammeovirga kamogawensis]|uniref:Leucine-rich repeat domain-containing protein n=1 Tax=Flammeovirga kamogawensis TaxID=373891 RepID=A0ABX8H4E8_9BACT|nr:hypothetical protein [Flammeovirga kamogawensis]MBB6463859.1 hypothetical protein [Flammeovirga kamogawensis]QWG10783.1 hypothetical protein KM029_26615 [Flammeovirga kamogawensis]TRX63231.1 hypothetical protein EO216_26615 [Flammeovirga kamogawensis]